MGKKVEKGLNKEKNQSATSQDDTDSNKALGKSHVCSIELHNSNSSMLCLFWASWLAGEKVLHSDKFHEQESWNYFPSASSKNVQ